MTIEQRIADIIATHKPCIGYYSTGTTLDDSQRWTPACECGHSGFDLPSEEEAEARHRTHVAAVLVAELGLTEESGWGVPEGGPGLARYVSPWVPVEEEQ